MPDTAIDQQTTGVSAGRMVLQVLVGLGIALYAWIVFKTAWLCDDAYITFRTIDNFIHGYGLTWNTYERVQAYTHPLWMFLLSGFCYYTHEIYFTSLFVSMAVSVAAVMLLVTGIARSMPQATLALTILLSSKAFIDYSTSGLENPLSYLLLGLFLAVYFSNKPVRPGRLLVLSLIGSLCLVNRMDTLLLFAPALLHAVWLALRPGRSASEGPVVPFDVPATVRIPRSAPAAVVVSQHSGLSTQHSALPTQDSALRTQHSPPSPGLLSLSLSVVLGFLPFLAWEVFSVIYYGFPFPNTAYAKLSTGIPQSDLAEQGLYYFLNSLRIDPLTLITILAAVVAALYRGRRKQVMLALGVLLYLVYIDRIGGDFMSGRFFAVPLFAAVAIFASIRWDPSRRRLALLLVIVMAAGLCAPHSSLRSGNTYGQQLAGIMDRHRISDERATCFPATGLLRANSYFTPPDHPWVDEGIRLRIHGPRSAAFSGIGWRGYYAGPDVRIIDLLALADPLLARLPAQATMDWRIGHFRRIIPAGYGKVALPSQIHLTDPHLDAFYRKLTLITQAPLFAPGRFRAIWEMNLGRYDYLIDTDACRFPGQVRTTLARLASLSIPAIQPTATQRAPGARPAPATRPQVLPFTEFGILVDLGRPIHTPSIELDLTGNTTYRITWLHGRQELAASTLRSAREPTADLAPFPAIVPDDVVRTGYDAMRIQPFRAKTPCALGNIRISPNAHD